MNDELSFWLSDVPEIDRNRDEYIVLPSNGMITPINVVPNESADYSKEPIGVGRLDARPIATLSLEAQERHERMERTHRDE